MSLIKSLVVVVVVLAVPVSPALAIEPGEPTVSYVGDMKITGDAKKKLSTLKLYYEPNRQRRELSFGGQSIIVITDGVAKTATMLFPERKMYAIRPLPLSLMRVSPLRLGRSTYEAVGEEKCGAFTCVKYKVSGNSLRGGKFQGFVWYTKDHNIPMRIDGLGETNGKGEKIAMVMENVKVGPIDPKRFAVPDGYKKMPRPN